jgi:hypothetical protein
MSTYIILDGYATVKRTPETDATLLELLEDSLFDRLATEENGDGDRDITTTDDAIKLVFCPEVANDYFSNSEWDRVAELLASLSPYITEPAYIRVKSDGELGFIFLGDPDEARRVEAVDAFNTLWSEISESAKDQIRGKIMREVVAKLEASSL